MGCASSMDNAVLPLADEIGDEVDVKMQSKLDKSKFLAGKFQRIELPKEIWLSRMATFIHSHMKQINHFSQADYDVMIARLDLYKKTIGPNPVKKDKHTHAVRVLETLFAKRINACVLDNILINTSIDYCNRDREHHFEEIMFILTILVHTPMMRYFETTY
jgi:hypothetical protein